MTFIPLLSLDEHTIYNMRSFYRFMLKILFSIRKKNNIISFIMIILLKLYNVLINNDIFSLLFKLIFSNFNLY